MNLLEYQGKYILEQNDINVPSGVVISSPEQLKHISYPVVLKAQVPMGGRGKSGGVLIVQDLNQAQIAFEKIMSLKIKGHTPEGILAEELVKIQREMYFSLSIDREERKIALIFSELGGVNIEDIDRSNIKVIKINPLLGLQNYQLSEIFYGSKLDRDLITKTKDMVKKLYNIFMENKLELLEINPLTITEENKLVALDCKVTVDDNYIIPMHEEVLEKTTDDDSFETKIKAFGISAAELDGDISVVTSGAGLGLATIDAVDYYGGTVRSFTDLGGLVYDRDKMKSVIKLIKELRPKVILFNFFFQVARCDTLAEAIVNALDCNDIPIVVRVKGKYENEAKYILDTINCHITDDFGQSVIRAVKLCQERSESYGNIS